MRAMSNSLADILGKFNYDEPPEVASIKQYVERMYKITPVVQVRPRDIVITIPNGSLANTLRFEAVALQKAAGTSKKLVFRIGS
jgi:hypothetical protein